MPKSASRRSTTGAASGTLETVARSSGSAASSTGAGIRTEDSGACAARAKMSITWPAVGGFGSVSGKARPSSPSGWAMWSIAATTKSTGTMLISRPSMPTIGTHCGTVLRIRRISLKK